MSFSSTRSFVRRSYVESGLLCEKLGDLSLLLQEASAGANQESLILRDELGFAQNNVNAVCSKWFGWIPRLGGSVSC